MSLSNDTKTLFLAALLVNPSNLSETNSAIYYRGKSWVQVASPQSMDQDAMPKDRMAILVDPTNSSNLYVAGNAGSVVYRVHWQSPVTWTNMMTTNDTVTVSQPHVDCRSLTWNPTTNSLLLTSDGGIFQRTQPATVGGNWTTKNGDIDGE